MKNVLLSVLILAAFGSTAAMAADTGTINASATVLATCKFNQNQGALAFGTLDAKTGSGAVATANLSYSCTNGTQSVVSLNNGVNFSDLKNMDQTSLIRYTLSTMGENQVGTGFGSTPLLYEVNGAITFEAYSQAKAGSHVDTIFVSLTE